MVPVSFAVLLLKFTGVLDYVAQLCEPLFVLFGLPGEAAIVFVTSCLLNLYSCIAVIETLELSQRTITILALMCLISHNLPVECAVQKRSGSSAGRMVLVRLVSSFVGALALNFLLPGDGQQVLAANANGVLAMGDFSTEFVKWLQGISVLCAKVVIIITVLTIVQRILEEFGIVKFLARGMKYPLMLLGLPRHTAFLWIVANTIGLAGGSGVIIDNVKRGKISQPHADALNHHIAVSHSLIEDTCLFLAIGASFWWITIPRFILAGIVVWLKRFTDRIRLRKVA